MNKKILSPLVMLFTLFSIFPVFIVRSRDFQTSLFWMYTILTTLFLIFMYSSAYVYKPKQDSGFRPDVNVIIPVKNEEDAIKDTIRTVLNSDYPSEKLYITVVDDGSTDKTVNKINELMEEVKSDRVIFIRHERNYGKCAALATGVEKSKSDIIICIDSDSYVDKDAIKLLVQPLVDKRVVAVCGHGYAYNKDKNILTILQHFWYQEMFMLNKGMESIYGSVTCCPGILSAYRKSVVYDILKEWLTEAYVDKLKPVCEDKGLDRSVLDIISDKIVKCLAKSKADDSTLTVTALSNDGARIVYQSNAIVYTIVPETFGQFVKQQLRWTRAWVYGTFLASKFMWKKPFPVPIYFYTYQFLTYVSPAVIFIWAIVRPISGDLIGFTDFLAGTLYVGLLHGLNIWRNDKMSNFIDPVFYRTIFVFISIFLAIFIMPYAWVTVWKGGWLTRGGNVK